MLCPEDGVVSGCSIVLITHLPSALYAPNTSWDPAVPAAHPKEGRNSSPGWWGQTWEQERGCQNTAGVCAQIMPHARDRQGTEAICEQGNGIAKRDGTEMRF